MIVPGDDFRALFIGHGRGNLVQRGAEQIRHDLVDRTDPGNSSAKA